MFYGQVVLRNGISYRPAIPAGRVINRNEINGMRCIGLMCKRDYRYLEREHYIISQRRESGMSKKLSAF